jgi:hypothetical protein
MVLQNVYYYTALVVNSRVLLIYTDTVKELTGCAVQNCPSGGFLFEGGGGCRQIYMILCELDAPEDTLENVLSAVTLVYLSQWF